MPFFRYDGRVASEFRGKELRLGEMSKFDGSAWLSQGGTTVLACVNGPIAARAAVEDFRKAIVEVTLLRACLLPSGGGASKYSIEKAKIGLNREDAELSSKICNVLNTVLLLENFPRCCFSVAVHVLSDDGSLFSAAINSVMSAVLDAGIPCRTTIAAVSLAVVQIGTTFEILFDPTEDEQAGKTLPETSPCAELVALGSFVFTLPESGGGVAASSITAVGAHTLSFCTYEYLEKRSETATANIFDFFRSAHCGDSNRESEGILV